MNNISAWSRSIVIAVIITVIIEMILPDNNSKKYIKIVLGIFVVYSIISPAFEYFSLDSVDNLIDSGEAVIEASSSNTKEYNGKNDYTDSAIRNIYFQSLQSEINKLLMDDGYVADVINVDIAKDDTYSINVIDVKIKEKKVDKNKENNKKEAQSIVETIKRIVIDTNQNKSKEDEESVVNENDRIKIKRMIHEKFRC